MVASAARVGTRNLNNLSRNSRADGWQTAAWGFYHTIGEFRYACDWVGSMLSKAVMHATQETDQGIVKLTTGSPVEILDELFGDRDGRAEMLRLLGIHFSVTGEAWIVAYPNPDEFSDGSDVWEVVASTRITQPAGETGYWNINGRTLEVDPKQVLAIRLWRPDPLDPDTAISPARALLSTLGELSRLGDHVAAQIDSRLAGAGILLMPSEMTFATPPDPDNDGTDPAKPARSANSAEDLMQIITELMATSIDNRSHASAMVPLVITAPADAIAAVKHITFWSGLDAQAIELRNEAIRRLALGMDMPPEVLQGSKDSNHWAAWQADEASIKSHTEPLLKIITTSLASGFLRPLLKDDKTFKEPLRKFSLMADTYDMRLRPNRSKEALELYNLGELSGVALVRETGFDAEDAMSDEERAAWFTRKVAGGSTTPEIVEAALRELGVVLKVVHDTQAPETIRDTIHDDPNQPQGTQTPPPPSLKGLPNMGTPDRVTSERRKSARDAGTVPSADRMRKSSLIAASEMAVVRALERAGNKLKSKMSVKPTCAAADIYKFVSAEDTAFLLDDAWGHVPAVAERYAVEENRLVGILNSYTEKVLTTQEPHTFEKFEDYASEQLDRTGVFA
jgi:hypothetical protein